MPKWSWHLTTPLRFPIANVNFVFEMDDNIKYTHSVEQLEASNLESMGHIR